MSEPVQPASAPEPPSAPPQATAGAVPPAAAPVVAPKRRALGIWSFVLALLAVLGDIIAVVAAGAALASLVGNLPEIIGGEGGLGGSLVAIFGGFILLLFAYWGGIVLAAISILLAIIAFVRRSGVAFAVVGLIFSLGVLVTHIALFGAITNVPGAG